MTFSEKLKLLRVSNGMTQKEFSQIIGVAQSSINYWENGQRVPSIEAVARIADYYNITIESLLSDKNSVVQQNPFSILTGTYFNQADNVADIHFSTDDYSLEELNQIWQYAHFIKTQRNN